MRAPDKAGPKWPIAAVERDTGIGKDTLRVWERRYGFPQPERDACGERVYTQDEVIKLRLIRRLLDRGLRPGKLVSLPADSLAQLVCGGENETGRSSDLLPLLRVDRWGELRSMLAQRLACQGLRHFVLDTAAPLGRDIGRAWMRGEIGIPEEHLYTEAAQSLLRGAIAGLPTAAGNPHVLLTTLPGEVHGLGMLMAEALLVSEGACCVSLGTQTPLPDIVDAAHAGGFHVVGLSFSSAFPARQAVDALMELRIALPASMQLWVGGCGTPPLSKLPPGIRGADDVLGALGAWRAAH